MKTTLLIIFLYSSQLTYSQSRLYIDFEHAPNLTSMELNGSIKSIHEIFSDYPYEYTYHFDSLGRLLELKQHFKDSITITLNYYEYENGVLLRARVKSGVISYEYDKFNRLIAEHTFDTLEINESVKNSGHTSKFYFYNKKNQLIKYRDNFSTRIIYDNYYKYNKKGNLIREKLYEISANLKKKYTMDDTKYEYNSENQLIKSTSNHHTELTIYNYYENYSETIQVDLYQTMIWKNYKDYTIIFRFREGKDMEQTQYTKEEDEKGNMIKTIRINRNGTVDIITRKIEYF